MSIEGQFQALQAPTFLEINRYLKAFYYLYNDLLSDFKAKQEENCSSSVAQLNHQITSTFEQISKTESFLRKKLRFYDVEADAFEIQVRTLSAMMELPSSTSGQLVEKTKRRKPQSVRERHRGPYRSYTIQQKNHVVHLSSQGMKFAAISKRLGIPQKNIVRWCKEGFLVREVRRKSDAEMEEALAMWIQERRQYSHVKHWEIQSKAREMAANRHFKASRGWLKNFLARLEKPSVKLEYIEE